MGTSDEQNDDRAAVDSDERLEDQDPTTDEAPEEAEEAPAPRPARAAASRARAAAPARGGSSYSKNLIVFVVVLGALAAGFAYLGKDSGPQVVKAPKWKTGETVDVEITLVAKDATELACASPDEVAGKHCAFEAQGKAWTKGPSTDDKTLLKPYTTTNRIQFAAAGLWSEPALSGANLPKNRFSVKCKYKVEGELKKPAIRWASDGPWYPADKEWYAGTVSGCELIK